MAKCTFQCGIQIINGKDREGPQLCTLSKEVSMNTPQPRIGFAVSWFLACLGTPLAAQTNLGPVNVGGNTSDTVTVMIPNAATLGSISVRTQGVEGLDFNNLGGGSCTIGTAYAAGDTCTVVVAFTPKFVGPRYGAVVLNDDSGNPMATLSVRGSGVGPLVNFLPATESQLGIGLSAFSGMTVDGNGAVYLSNSGTGVITKEIPSGSGYTATTVLSGLTDPSGMAVDGSGNLYIGEWSAGSVIKEAMTATGYAETTIATGLNEPNGLPVDSSGNVYISDSANGRLLKEAPSGGSYTQTDILDCGYVGDQSCPSGVAVDQSGNLFVVGYIDNQIMKLTPAAGGYTESLFGEGLNWPSNIVIDGVGNLYVADTLNDRIVKETLSAGNYTQSTFSTTGALDWPWWVGVDSSGNVFISDVYTGKILREDVASPPSLTFATTAEGSVSSDSPQTVTVFNQGNAPLDISAVDYPPDFPEAAPATGACTATASLAAEAVCTLPIEFKPVTQSGGSPVLLSESVGITTDSLNTAGAESAIAVSGTETSGVPLVVLPLSLGFGSQSVGATSAAMAVTLTNNGSLAVTLSGNTIKGADASAFAISASTCATSLAAKSSCTISVTFTPAATGSMTATLAIANSAASSPVSMGLTGTGAAPQTLLSLFPGRLYFGVQGVGSTSDPETLIIHNNNNIALNLSTAITPASSDFVQSATTCGSSIAAHTFCLISVTYSPTVYGMESATLTLSDGVDNSTPQTISLIGVGVTQFRLSTTSLTFGSQTIGVASQSEIVTIANDTSAVIGITSTTIGGVNSGNFSQTAATCGASLAGHTRCTISLSFLPTTADAYAATLIITDGATNSPHTVSLTGRGVPSSQQQ
jgi:sugar lactone lactonase YvrE